MAKKGPEKVQVKFYFPPDLRRRLRLAAADQDLRESELVVALLEKHLPNLEVREVKRRK